MADANEKDLLGSFKALGDESNPAEDVSVSEDVRRLRRHMEDDLFQLAMAGMSKPFEEPR